jgi:outer membrane protein assembly factor BamB
MERSVLVGCILTLVLRAGLALAAEPNPEPEPAVGSSATSSGLTIRVEKNGIITATNKRGEKLWTTMFRKGKLVDAKGQVVITRVYAVVAQAGFVYSLEVATGRIIWSRDGLSRSAQLSVKGAKVTLQHGAKRQVFDLKTGKLLESAP